jgi:hypothetical protein
MPEIPAFPFPLDFPAENKKIAGLSSIPGPE